jgi:uncharacterized protein YhdP
VTRRRRLVGLLLVLAALLLAARAAAPVLLQRYVNRVLDRTDGYSGSIGDVDLSLLRGAYSIEDVEIEKSGGKVPVPFLRAREVDLSLEWRALFDGSLVGEVWLTEPQLNFVAGPTRARGQTGAEADWRKTVRDLLPVKVNRITVRDGSVHFRNFTSQPPVDVYLRDVDLVVRNLTNSLDLSGDLVARASGTARTKGAARLSARLSLDPYADQPTFDFEGQARDFELAPFNDFLRAYAGADVQRGKAQVYAELAASDGRFEGYVKPFFEDVDVLHLEEEIEEQGLLASLWEALVGTTAEALQDQSEDRVATRIPIAGSADSPEVDFWRTLGNVLRNAFVEALVPALEHSVGKDGEPRERG